jgi:hypothetical protein
MSTDLQTPAELLEHMDGAPAVADGLGIPAPVVFNWRKRGSIPAPWWVPLVALAERKGRSGVTLETLAEMHAKKPSGATPVECAR